jgi:hypothetical protein
MIYTPHASPAQSAHSGKVRYSTAQYSTVQYRTVQYRTVQYSTVNLSTLQYSSHVMQSHVKNVYKKSQYGRLVGNVVRLRSVTCAGSRIVKLSCVTGLRSVMYCEAVMCCRPKVCHVRQGRNVWMSIDLDRMEIVSLEISVKLTCVQSSLLITR